MYAASRLPAQRNQRESYLTSNLPSEARANPPLQRAKNEKTAAELRASESLSTAGAAAALTAPVITLFGLGMIREGASDSGPLGSLFVVAGIPLTVGGLVIDLGKPVVTVPTAVIYAIKGLFEKIYARIARPPKDTAQLKALTESTQKRLGATARLLVHLGLETPDSIAQIFDNWLTQPSAPESLRGLARLFEFTALHSAYASRGGLQSDALLLANNRLLRRTDCPKSALPIFDAIIAVKAKLVALGLGTKSNSEAEPFIHEWLPVLKGQLEGTPTRLPQTAQSVQILQEITASLKSIGQMAIGHPSVSAIGSPLHGAESVHLGSVPPYVPPAPTAPAPSRQLALGVPILERPEPAAPVFDSYGANAPLDTLLSQLRQLNMQQPYRQPPSPPVAPNRVVRPAQWSPEVDAWAVPIVAPAPALPHEPLLDAHTGNPIEILVVGNDGMPYDKKTAEELQKSRRKSAAGRVITQFVVVLDVPPNPYRDTPELCNCPITMDRMAVRVLGNDGRFYDKATYDSLHSAGQNGVCGFELTGFISCTDADWTRAGGQARNRPRP